MGAADETAQAREALRQRTDDERVVVVAQRVEHGAASLPAHDAGSVGVIDIEDGTSLQADAIQFRQRRQLAAHAVNAVDGDDGTAIVAGLVQNLFQSLRIAVREEDDARAVGLGDLGSLLNRVVRLLVHDQHILPADQSGDGAHVGQRHGRINQRRFRAQPLSELLLGHRIGAYAGKGARGAVVRAPAANAATQRVLNARILIQTQETIGAEIDDLLAGHLDDAMRPHVIDDHVFHVRRWEKLGEMLKEANQAVLAQGAGQLLHRGGTHTDLLFHIMGNNPPGSRRRCRSRQPAHQTKNDESGQA